ncbi:phosphoketolase family protein [Pseudokineococcus sp. 5B2Z-1]|uniref:phosphoketolase family protein n=1 Tax=Pseudokineococcus sp. 5B2Z-1 TaxID=3132744 RepID=UPI00403FBA93
MPHLDAEELARVDAWWRAATYLAVGQVHLQMNPLLRRPLVAEDVKPRLLGHWGTCPGLTFVHAHVSRLVRWTGQETLFLTGPGHGGPALAAASWLEGTWTGAHPAATRDEAGMRRLFRDFSAPGGVPSHVSASTPGSIHEGGELGYVLLHAFGAVMDDPRLLAVAVVGDGEAETAPLEGSWKGVSFLDPRRDGAVLPVLHLNGAKLSGPTVLARKRDAELRDLLAGHGYEVVEVAGDDLPGVHHRFAAALASAHQRIRAIQQDARSGRWDGARPRWPVLVLRTPKGWTGPDVVDGRRVAGTHRAHQVPLPRARTDAEHRRALEAWMRSYRPEDLFDDAGRPTPLVLANQPPEDLVLSASPRAHGRRSRPLQLPDWRRLALPVASPGLQRAESTRLLGELLRLTYAGNPTTFRLFSPDETASNRLDAVFGVSDRAFAERVEPDDEHTSASGRVMEVLSEHTCHGWLEGYTLTGRHGLFATYEAFGMVSASQTVQHATWLAEARALPWREPVPSLNVLLTSTAWRGDHNGFSHQGPGLIDVVLAQDPQVARVYLPPDGNTLLAVADHCLRSRGLVNVVAIDEQPQLQWLTASQAAEHCAHGASTWAWAGSEDGDDLRAPDVVLACAGDVMTMEAVAAAQLLRDRLPALRVRVVNVVDLQSLRPPLEHSHGMDEVRFLELFTATTDVVMAFHGHPGTVHQLLHGRPRAERFHVRGFVERGTTTTPFDMTVRGRVSRYHLAMDAVRVSRHLPHGAADLVQWCREQLERHHAHIREHLEDLPEVRDWRLLRAPAHRPPASGPGPAGSSGVR